MTIVIVSGGIDLSVGSVIALTTVVIALLLRADGRRWLAALAGVGAAAAVRRWSTASWSRGLRSCRSS